MESAPFKPNRPDSRQESASIRQKMFCPGFCRDPFRPLPNHRLISAYHGASRTQKSHTDPSPETPSSTYTWMRPSMLHKFHVPTQHTGHRISNASLTLTEASATEWPARFRRIQLDAPALVAECPPSTARVKCSARWTDLHSAEGGGVCVRVCA